MYKAKLGGHFRQRKLLFLGYFYVFMEIMRVVLDSDRIGLLGSADAGLRIWKTPGPEINMLFVVWQAHSI